MQRSLRDMDAPNALAQLKVWDSPARGQRARGETHLHLGKEWEPPTSKVTIVCHNPCLQTCCFSSPDHQKIGWAWVSQFRVLFFFNIYRIFYFCEDRSLITGQVNNVTNIKIRWKIRYRSHSLCPNVKDITKTHRLSSYCFWEAIFKLTKRCCQRDLSLIFVKKNS